MHEFGETEVPIEQQKGKKDYTTILEDDVWLGLRVIVMPGITIKRGSIIGAGAVLTKSTSEYCIYGGVPAKLIRARK
jgi:maltose O-acetyltransferase